MRDSPERSEPVRDVLVKKLCIEPVSNGYVIDVIWAEKNERWIMGNARVMLHLLAGLLGYDLEIKSMTPKEVEVEDPSC
jgi:hypothetical protein